MTSSVCLSCRHVEHGITPSEEAAAADAWRPHRRVYSDIQVGNYCCLPSLLRPLSVCINTSIRSQKKLSCIRTHLLHACVHLCQARGSLVLQGPAPVDRTPNPAEHFQTSYQVLPHCACSFFYYIKHLLTLMRYVVQSMFA
jgi:hypothetical protein